MKEKAYDLHVLGTPPAFVLSQDQTLIIKVRTIFRLLSSICLLAYCLLFKNVCCLELNQDALHIWFVLLCSVFKGLFFFCFNNFYILTDSLEVVNTFCFLIFRRFFNDLISLSFSLLFVNNFFIEISNF